MIINAATAESATGIGQTGIVALFAPDAPDGTKGTVWFDFGEVYGSGKFDAVNTSTTTELKGRRKLGEYTVKTLSSSVEDGFDFGTLRALDPQILALHRGIVTPDVLAGTHAGVKALGLRAGASLSGQFIWSEWDEDTSDAGLAIITYHQRSLLTADGTGNSNNVKTLQFKARAGNRDGGTLPVDLDTASISEAIGAVYITDRPGAASIIAAFTA